MRGREGGREGEEGREEEREGRGREGEGGREGGGERREREGGREEEEGKEGERLVSRSGHTASHTHLIQCLQSNLNHLLSGLRDDALGAIVGEAVLPDLLQVSLKLLPRLVQVRLAVLGGERGGK